MLEDTYLASRVASSPLATAQSPSKSWNCLCSSSPPLKHLCARVASSPEVQEQRSSSRSSSLAWIPILASSTSGYPGAAGVGLPTIFFLVQHQPSFLCCACQGFIRLWQPLAAAGWGQPGGQGAASPVPANRRGQGGQHTTWPPQTTPRSCTPNSWLVEQSSVDNTTYSSPHSATL